MTRFLAIRFCSLSYFGIPLGVLASKTTIVASSSNLMSRLLYVPFLSSEAAILRLVYGYGVRVTVVSDNNDD